MDSATKWAWQPLRDAFAAERKRGGDLDEYLLELGRDILAPREQITLDKIELERLTEETILQVENIDWQDGTPLILGYDPRRGPNSPRITARLARPDELTPFLEKHGPVRLGFGSDADRMKRAREQVGRSTLLARRDLREGTAVRLYVGPGLTPVVHENGAQVHVARDFEPFDLAAHAALVARVEAAQRRDAPKPSPDRPAPRPSSGPSGPSR